MRALTLHRPWSDGIAYSTKRIENRVWAPWRSIVGEHIAIHAGQTFDALDPEELPDGFALPSKTDSPLGIVAIARVRGAVRTLSGSRAVITDVRDVPSCAAVQHAASPWYVPGLYGWILDDVVAIPPVPCSGRQGLWTVPAGVRRRVTVRFRAVSEGLLDPRPLYLRAPARAAELRELPADRFLERAVRAGYRAEVGVEGLAQHEVAGEMQRELLELAEMEDAA